MPAYLRLTLGALLMIVTILCVGCHGEDHGVISPVTQTASPVSPTQGDLLGDLDGDGVPGVSDAIRILRIIVGLDPVVILSDCNEDGATTIADAIILLRCVVGLDPWPIERRDPELGDETPGPDGQTLVWVPGGDFMMGSEEGGFDERPVHQVTLDGFWIGKYEVTNDQYATYLNDSNSDFPPDWLVVEFDDAGVEYADGHYQAKEGLGQHPVVVVAWYGAVAYCNHYGYALPTEAQWEYAAAGPDARTYPWGNTWDLNKCCNRDNKGPFDRSFEIDSFPAGASWCGALNMAGNVYELCADWYDRDYYENSPAANPPGPDTGEEKVLRGGAWWAGDEESCRCANRYRNEPNQYFNDTGFRVVAGGG